MAANVPFPRINRLPDNLVNSIAAGEVIERPASVAKELLENCLDAGATRIRIDIENAGTRLLRITDNGQGIHADDLALALERHTTSKLQEDSDLARIATLGFRGEALSSIAAVSRLTLISCPHGAGQAQSATFIPSANSISIKPAAHPQGTTVEVRDLFYNTPARRKFLCSEKTELMHIQDLVKRVVLSRPALSLQLQHNNQRLWQFDDDSHDPLRRVQAVLGSPFVKRAIAVSDNFCNMSLHGWIGPADLSRSQVNQQYVFLNGRMIRDRLINHAIRLAYQDRLHPGRHPVYVLYLEMDLAAADVNVHPTKHEVRFRDKRAVHDFIYGSLARHLEEQMRHDSGLLQHGGNRRNVYETGITAGQTVEAVKDTAVNYRITSAHCLLRGRFILAEEKDSVVLLDVYRARKRIVHYKLLQALQSNALAAQPVLVPLVYKDDIKGCESLLAHAEDLERFAIQVKQVSPSAVQIRSFPRLLPYADVMALVRNLLPLLNQRTEESVWLDAMCARMAEHANDLAPVSLSSPESQALLDEFSRIRGQLPAEQCRGVVRQLDSRALSEVLQRDA